MKRRIAALMLIMALIPTGIVGCGEEEVEEVVEEDVITTINIDVEDETDKLLQEQIDEYDSSLEEEKKKEPIKEEEQALDNEDTDIMIINENETVSGDTAGETGVSGDTANIPEDEVITDETITEEAGGEGISEDGILNDTVGTESAAEDTGDIVIE